MRGRRIRVRGYGKELPRWNSMASRRGFHGARIVGYRRTQHLPPTLRSDSDRRARNKGNAQSTGQVRSQSHYRSWDPTLASGSRCLLAELLKEQSLRPVQLGQVVRRLLGPCTRLLMLGSIHLWEKLRGLSIGHVGWSGPGLRLVRGASGAIPGATRPSSSSDDLADHQCCSLRLLCRCHSLAAHSYVHTLVERH